MATINLEGIQFNNVKTVGVKMNLWPIYLSGQQGPDEDGGIINAVDIDWNEAEVEEDKTINTTGELLSWIKELKQEIPNQVLSNWNESDSNNPAYILNKPDLSLYLTEQALENYVTLDLLSGKADSLEVNNKLSRKANSEDLANVATSGKYSDLLEIPEAASEENLNQTRGKVFTIEDRVSHLESHNTSLCEDQVRYGCIGDVDRIFLRGADSLHSIIGPLNPDTGNPIKNIIEVNYDEQKGIAVTFKGAGTALLIIKCQNYDYIDNQDKGTYLLKVTYKVSVNPFIRNFNNDTINIQENSTYTLSTNIPVSQVLCSNNNISVTINDNNINVTALKYGNSAIELSFFGIPKKLYVNFVIGQITKIDGEVNRTLNVNDLDIIDIYGPENVFIGIGKEDIKVSNPRVLSVERREDNRSVKVTAKAGGVCTVWIMTSEGPLEVNYTVNTSNTTINNDFISVHDPEHWSSWWYGAYIGSVYKIWAPTTITSVWIASSNDPTTYNYHYNELADVYISKEENEDNVIIVDLSHPKRTNAGTFIDIGFTCKPKIGYNTNSEHVQLIEPPVMVDGDTLRTIYVLGSNNGQNETDTITIKNGTIESWTTDNNKISITKTNSTTLKITVSPYESSYSTSGKVEITTDSGDVLIVNYKILKHPKYTATPTILPYIGNAAKVYGINTLVWGGVSDHPGVIDVVTLLDGHSDLIYKGLGSARLQFITTSDDNIYGSQSFYLYYNTTDSGSIMSSGGTLLSVITLKGLTADNPIILYHTDSCCDYISVTYGLISTADSSNNNVNVENPKIYYSNLENPNPRNGEERNMIWVASNRAGTSTVTIEAGGSTFTLYYKVENNILPTYLHMDGGFCLTPPKHYYLNNGEYICEELQEYSGLIDDISLTNEYYFFVLNYEVEVGNVFLKYPVIAVNDLGDVRIVAKNRTNHGNETSSYYCVWDNGGVYPSFLGTDKGNPRSIERLARIALRNNSKYNYSNIEAPVYGNNIDVNTFNNNWNYSGNILSLDDSINPSVLGYIEIPAVAVS